MNLLERIRTFFYTLIRGYLAEVRVRGSRRKARQWVEDALAGTKPVDELQIHYWAGSEYWVGGHTFSVISGDGQFYLRNVTTSNVVEVQGTLTVQEFKSLLQTMISESWFSVSPKHHPGRPDDSETMLALVDINADLKFYIKMWEAQVRQYTPFEVAVRQIRSWITQASNGSITA